MLPCLDSTKPTATVSPLSEIPEMVCHDWVLMCSSFDLIKVTPPGRWTCVWRIQIYRADGATIQVLRRRIESLAWPDA